MGTASWLFWDLRCLSSISWKVGERSLGIGNKTLYLSHLEIARTTRGSHNQQGTQESSPETLRIELPYHPPQLGFWKASNQRGLGREMGWGKEK